MAEWVDGSRRNFMRKSSAFIIVGGAAGFTATPAQAWAPLIAFLGRTIFGRAAGRAAWGMWRSARGARAVSPAVRANSSRAATQMSRGGFNNRRGTWTGEFSDEVAREVGEEVGERYYDRFALAFAGGTEAVAASDDTGWQCTSFATEAPETPLLETRDYDVLEHVSRNMTTTPTGVTGYLYPVHAVQQSRVDMETGIHTRPAIYESPWAQVQLETRANSSTPEGWQYRAEVYDKLASRTVYQSRA